MPTSISMLSLSLCLAVLGSAALVPRDVHAAARERSIEIPLGGSQAIRIQGAVERIVVGDPTLCDVVGLPGGQVLVTAKLAGETHITVTGRDGGVTTYHVLTSIPVEGLQQALKEAFPSEEGLSVKSVGGAVYLTGTLHDPITAEAASRLATSMYGSSSRRVSEVINLTQIAAPQQVQVHLKFVEISRTNLRDMGFNMWANNNTSAGALFGPNQPFHYCITCDNQRFVGPSNPPIAPGGQLPYTNANPYLPILMTPITGTFALSFATSKVFPFTATLALLESRGVAKTLSEPTLVAMSGHEAKFLVGGEFPIPVPDAMGRVLVQFKSYGAQLSFTPTVLGQETVNLKVDSVVSDIDKSNAIVLSSASVPALQSRQSTTSVRLRDGQTFAIAGLLSDRIQSTSQRIPVLGEIPLIGMFFRSMQHQRNQTELVVMVTVKLVKPMDPGEVPPAVNQDEFTDPSDLELFLLGWQEKTKVGKTPAAADNKDARSATMPNRATMLGSANNPDGVVGFSR